MSYQKNEVGEEIWNDIILPAAGLGIGAAAPALVDFDPITGMKVYSFSGTNSTPDELFGIFEIPHDYEEGTDLSVHVHWAAENDTVADVKWQCSYSLADNLALFPAGQLITKVVSTIGKDKHLITGLDPDISGVGLKIGAIVCCRLFRDATDPADTYTGGARLLSFGVHYQSDTLGSSKIISK
jgi:hypothetical protein